MGGATGRGSAAGGRAAGGRAAGAAGAHGSDLRAPGAALRTAAVRGLDVVTTVKDTAAEALRTRRDPALVAERRRVAARRRLTAWSFAALILTALGTVSAIDVAHGSVAVTTIGGLVLAAGLWVYSVVGSITAARDLRVRTLVTRNLPPPQPARRVVTGEVRPLMARLDAYSDALRSGIGTIGADRVDVARRRARTRESVGSAQGALREVRDDTLAAADAAEIRLRLQAAELSAMLRAAGHDVGGPLASTCAEMRRDLEAGVDEYGRLVLAAADASTASRQIAVAAGAGDDVLHATERLTALAAGMRELIDPGRAPR